ncbi:hypothetical protein H072_1277 [Dactylellina haptotyla CBS 200.50]|uniref:Uncharacterized protein n=1 Tax=Dactylellina haptotyla (strain CBS 200.50) TaxID=1284197 RepID=S8AUU1_DACHA|nr:hypothetical protein H072_1277 [Dactylellina haptotyla CBS 200.50]
MADTGELLDIIKDECALTVTQGLPVTSVWKLVTDYLENDKTTIVPLETLDPTVPNPPTSYHPALPLDISLRNTIWDAIRKDDDISIGINNEGKGISFDDAEAGVDARSHQKGKSAEWRLYASERLQWKRIAGHEIDTVRLFPTLWQLLKIIAMNKEDGILQPDLTTQSGQDARSVGPRTKDLAGKGYIMKIPVIANKMRTSKLILKRFYKGALEKRRTQKKKRMATIKEHAKTGKKLPKEMLEEPLDIEEVISGTFKLLKSAKNKVMLIEDLKFRLNCTSTRSRRKACRRIMSKLEVMGCIQKIRAMGSENVHAKKFEMGPVDEEDLANLKSTRFAKCVKFIRDLRPLEWQEAVKGVRPAVLQDELDDMDEDIDSDDEQDDGYRVIRSAPSTRAIDGRRVTVPLWRSSHLMHTIYDQILASGMEGIRSGMLSGAVFGPFYYRPFDQIMGRWTTNSLQNQPDHLKSTSIVRETDMYKRTANYRYWTTENFKAMLDDQQIDYKATDAAANPYKIGQKTKKNSKNFEKIPIPEPRALDENGFMTINTATFINGNGQGSFQDCQNAAPKKGSGLKPPGVSPLKGRKKIKNEPIDGDDSDKPKNKRKSRKDAPNTDTQDAEGEPQDDAIVVIGRKRKYPPGTEPYLKEGPRVEAVKKALKLGSIKESLPDGKPLNPEDLPEGFQPLSSIDESSWTIEMVAERTFMDLVEGKPYQIPLATARYRSTNGKKGRPKKNPEVPTPELVHLGPIFQPGPDGPVQMTPPPEPDPDPETKKPAKRPYKRRKVDATPAEEVVTAVSTGSSPEQSITVETVPTPTPGEKTSKPRKSQRSTAGKKNNDAIDARGSNASINPAASKRKSRGKDTPVTTPPSKKTKTGTLVEATRTPTMPPPEEIMDVDLPLVNGTQKEIPQAIDQQEIVHETVIIDGNPSPASMDMNPPEESIMKLPQSDDASSKDAGVTDKQNTDHSEELEKSLPPKNGVQAQSDAIMIDTEISIPSEISQQNTNRPPSIHIIDLKTKTPIVAKELVAEEQPAPTPPDTPKPPKLEPYTDGNGVRMELMAAEVRKNRSIGGVLKASRRRLLLGMMASVDSAISINAGYRKFVQYIKDQKGQTSTMDRKTFNSIIDDTNMDGKILVIGVFKGPRRIGTILAMPDMTFQCEKVQVAKRVIVDELDKPFAWKQNVSKGIAAKTSNIPIERIDFERYSYAGKPIAFGNNSTRRRLDAEKMSTLARLQAITENEKKEKAASGKRRGGRRSAKPDAQAITSRTRSKTVTGSSLLSDVSSDEAIEVPRGTLHRWQVARGSAVETESLGSDLYETDEVYAAASALRNERESGFGTLQDDGYQSLQPKKRQQAGGRAGKSRAMMTNERDINPDLLPLVNEPKKRGRKPKQPSTPKEPKPPKERKLRPVKAPRVTRPKDVPRIRTTVEEDETLTLAIIIIRTLFGGYVRSIKWDLVSTALPKYDRWSIQAHWPRVRAKMKDEIPQYQAEFEEQYLRAFYKGKLPFFDKNRGVEFDLTHHVNWLRPLVKNIRPAVAERRILPVKREQIDNIYEITATPMDWRRDFFNYMTTMSWKEHQLMNHACSTVVKLEEEEESGGVIVSNVGDKRRAVERAKNAWRSIFITEDEKYDERKAQELMKAYTPAASTAALAELHRVDRFIIRSKKGGRFGTASAQARILQPWRTAFSTEMFEEAKGFHERVVEGFVQGGNEVKLVATGLNTGIMAWIVDRLVRGEIHMYTKDFKTSSRGLANSLVTRAINPVLFHFDIFVASAYDHDIVIPRPALDPASILENVPQGSMKEVAFSPFIWQNMHDEVIGYMWERIVRCVLAVVVAKPGVTTRGVVKALQGVVSERDVINVVRWLDPPRIDNQDDLTVSWMGRMIAIEFNRDNLDVAVPKKQRTDKPEIKDGFCLIDGSAGDSGLHQPIGTIPLQNDPNIQDFNLNYDPGRWSRELNCQGDFSATQWMFIGVKGKKADLVNGQPYGWALHDYAIGQIMNVKTERCLAIIRKDEEHTDGNIETVEHALQSEICDTIGEDDRQMWIIYFQERAAGIEQPFAPLIPAVYAGACWGPNAVAEENGRNITLVQPVPGAVYVEYTTPEHLRRVDTRYVAMSTFDVDDRGGISPVARCTGQKWFFDPPFRMDNTKFTQPLPEPPAPTRDPGTAGEKKCLDHTCPPEETPAAP